MRHRNKRPKTPNGNDQMKDQLCKEVKNLEAELIPRPKKHRFNGDSSEKGIAYTQKKKGKNKCF